MNKNNNDLKKLNLSKDMMDKIIMLLQKGYIIMLSYGSEYLFFSSPKTGAIGYWQSNLSCLAGEKYSTQYKPSKKYGTSEKANSDIEALDQSKKRDYWKDIFEFYNQDWNKDNSILIKGTIRNIKILKEEIK